jgi:hypothetical protein
MRNGKVGSPGSQSGSPYTGHGHGDGKVSVKIPGVGPRKLPREVVNLLDALVKSGFARSRGEAFRKLVDLVHKHRKYFDGRVDDSDEKSLELRYDYSYEDLNRKYQWLKSVNRDYTFKIAHIFERVYDLSFDKWFMQYVEPNLNDIIISSIDRLKQYFEALVKRDQELFSLNPEMSEFTDYVSKLDDDFKKLFELYNDPDLRRRYFEFCYLIIRLGYLEPVRRGKVAGKKISLNVVKCRLCNYKDVEDMTIEEVLDQALKLIDYPLCYSLPVFSLDDVFAIRWHFLYAHGIDLWKELEDNDAVTVLEKVLRGSDYDKIAQEALSKSDDVDKTLENVEAIIIVRKRNMGDLKFSEFLVYDKTRNEVYKLDYMGFIDYISKIAKIE